MVTNRRRQLNRPKVPRRRKFYLEAWRKHLKVSPAVLAGALDIERQSYHRLEKNWWTISTGEQEVLADALEIKPSQLWFPPPPPGTAVESLDEMIEDIPDALKNAAIAAVKGIAGR